VVVLPQARVCRDNFRYTLAACFCWGDKISNGENIFAGAYVDRSSHLRKDAEWLATAVQSSDSLFAPVWRDKCLAKGEPYHAVLLKREDVRDFLDEQEVVFLGMYHDKPAFAINVGHGDEAPFADAGEFHDLRYLGSAMPADDANLTAHARALVLWHRIQKFCGHCGSETRADCGGNSRTCIADGCKKQIFPRVDPAIIVLVADQDRCLLGRQTGWPEDRYSTIAGFVEPGESLEDAVQREVLEETNISTHDIQYHSSQPWPFPSALMLGFTATATSSEIRLNDEELEDAQWFTRKQLLSGFPKLPYRLSIARRLVDDWLQS